MSDAITFDCDGCNARIKAPHQLGGKVRACPGCGHRFVVPRARPRDEGPLLVPDDPPTLRAPSYSTRPAAPYARRRAS